MVEDGVMGEYGGPSGDSATVEDIVEKDRG